MASFRNTYDCFILRGRVGHEILQRIRLRDTRFLKDMIAVPATIAGTWSVQRRDFTIEEYAKAKLFTHYIRFSSLVLVNSEYSGTFTRLVEIKTLTLPSRGGLEIPKDCVLDAGGLQEFRQYVDKIHNASDRIHWIHPDGLLRQSVNQSVSQSMREASFSFSYSVNIPSILARPVVPPARPVVSPVVPEALKPYVARMLAEMVRSKAEDCPITLDSMASCRKLYVPTCGHVCSDAGCLTMQTCPVCRERTAWTPVEFTA